MAAVIIQKRASGKSHFVPVIEGTDSAILSDIERTTAGAATLWTDAFTTAITIGAAGTPVTVDDNLIVSGEIRGPSDGTGIVIGQASAGASTGSVLQVVSMTTTERDDVVAATGMLFFNSSSLSLQVRQNGSWINLPGAGGSSNQAIQPGVASLSTLMDYPLSGGMTTSEIQYTRVFLFADRTYDEMQVYIATGGGASRNVRLGVYDQATPGSTTGVPVDRVAQTAPAATTSDNGIFKVMTLLSTFTPAATGYYWLALIGDASQLRFATTETYRVDFLPTRRETGSGTTLPATAGSLTNPASAVAWVGAVEQ